MANLGTLTLDLVAKIGGFTGPLDEAGRKSKKFSKSVADGLDKIKTASAAAAAAVVASLTAMTVSTVQAASEIQKYASLAGASNQDFQKFAAATSVVGISSEKLADIMKDVNDKVGDFLQTGGGQLADFFEKIAPKVGVTADQFRNLSGPQALQLFVDTLEKAGANQQDFIFYMEGIANDASLLIPLLKDNAKGFKELGDAAEKSGAIMSDEVISKSAEIKGSMWLIEQSIKGAKNEIVAGMLPALAGISNAFLDTTSKSQIFAEAGLSIGGIISASAAIAIRAGVAINNLGRSIGAVAAASAALISGEFSQAKAIIAAVSEDNQKSTEAARAAVKRLYDESGEAAKRAKSIGAIFSEASRLPRGTGAKQKTKQEEEASKAAAAAAKANTKAIKDQIDAIQKQAETLGWSEKNIKLYELALKGASISQLKAAGAAIDAVDAYKAEQDQIKELTEAHSKYSDLVKELRTDEEKWLDTVKERLAIMDQAGITPNAEIAGKIAASGVTNAPTFGGVAPEVAGAAGELIKIDEAENELIKWIELQLEKQEKAQEFYDTDSEMFRAAEEQKLKIWKEFNDKKKALDQSRQKTQTDMFWQAMQTEASIMHDAFSVMGDITKNFAGEQSAAYKAMFAMQKIFAAAMIIANTEIAASKAGAELGILGLPLAGIIRVSGYANAAMVAGMGLAGMAHDGMDSIPETGTWLLKKGERVTTAETSAKLDRTLEQVSKDSGSGSSGEPIINIYEDRSKAGSVESRQQDYRRIIDIWVADVMGDGRAQKAITRKFGMQPVGA